MRSFVQNVLVDCTEEEGLMTLRQLQLEAYAAVVSAFRASGHLVDDKKNVLKQLQFLLGISTERHKAEVRRAVNTEMLSTIAFIRNGDVCNTSWQKEGRRLFGVLRRAVPKTEYTEIANRVAALVAKENKLIRDKQGKKGRKRPFKEVGPIVMATNPKLSGKKDQLLELESEKKSQPQAIDASTSTSDLYRFHVDNQSIMPKSNSQSYVYLPGGTVVHLEQNEALTETDEKARKTRSSSPLPVKRGRVGEQDEAPLIIKEVYRPDEMQEYRKLAKSPVRKRAPQTVFIAASSTAETTAKKPASTLSFDMTDKDATSNVQKSTFTSTAHATPFEMHKSKSIMLKRERPVHKMSPHVMKAEKQSSIIPQAPFPPEHLYAVGASSRPKASPRMQGSSWATKNTAATTSKMKKRVTKPPIQHLHRKYGSSTTNYSRLGWNPQGEHRGHEVYNFESDRNVIDLTRGNSNNSKVMQVKYGSFNSSDTRHLPINDSLFSNEHDSPPQKVFRPSMRMAGTKPQKKDRELQPQSSSSVETGLAPVSSIVSRVSSPAEGLSDRSSDYDVTEQQTTLLSSSGKVKMIRSTSQKNTFLKSRPTASSSGQFSAMHFSKPPGNALSKSLPGDGFLKMARDKDRHQVAQSPASETVTFEIKSLTSPSASPMLTSNVVKLKAGNPKYKFEGPAVDRDPSLREQQQQVSAGGGKSVTSVSIAASGLCALASASALATPSPTEPKQQSPAAAKEKLIAETKPAITSSIIKVTPRPMTSPKVVTQLGGQRSKPSIIVVHRPPGGKTVTSGPAKFLEIGNKSLTSQMSQLKSTGVSKTLTVPVCTATAFVKPVTPKLVSVGANVRTVSGKPVSATSIHKVITKGKMQQLVLKPSSSLLPSSQRAGASINRVFAASGGDRQPQQQPTILSSADAQPPHAGTVTEPLQQQQAPMSMHAASTIKALMAIQMSSGPSPVGKEVRAKTVVSGVHSLQPGVPEQRPTTFSGHNIAPVIKAAYKQQQQQAPPPSYASSQVVHATAAKFFSPYMMNASDEEDDDDLEMGFNDE